MQVIREKLSKSIGDIIKGSMSAILTSLLRLRRQLRLGCDIRSMLSDLVSSVQLLAERQLQSSLMLTSHALRVTIVIRSSSLAPILDGLLLPMAMVIPMHHHTISPFSSRRSLLRRPTKVCF